MKYGIAWLLAFPLCALAAPPAEIISVGVERVKGVDVVRVEFNQQLVEIPQGFTTRTPPSIVVDVVGARSRIGAYANLSYGSYKHVNIVQQVDRVRLIVSLASSIPGYQTEINGTLLTITPQSDTVPTVAIEAVTPTPPDSVSQPSITFSAPPDELIKTVRELMGPQGDPKQAIDILNMILLMPPSQYSEEAQNLIGIARERVGQFEKAKAENKAFLTMYPTSPLAKQVRERQIALEISAPTVITLNTRPPTEMKNPNVGHAETNEASISTYYYLGSTGSKALGWNTDQSTLVSNGRVSYSLKNDQYTTKAQVRYSRMDDLITSAHGRRLVSQAYVDFDDGVQKYGFRAGRQPSQAGVMSRFDGLLGRKELSPDTIVKIVAGSPSGTAGDTTHRRFYGGSVDFRMSDDTTGVAYYNRQYADQFLERSAIGGDLRYFKDRISATLSLEYDVAYKAFNLATFQLNGQQDPYSYFVLVDVRRTPTLYADRALVLGLRGDQHVPYTSIRQLLDQSGLTASDVYQFVTGATPIATSITAGINKQVSERWNLGVNIQTSNVTSNTDTRFVPTLLEEQSIVQTSSARSTSLNFQAYGNDIWTKGNTLTAMVNLTGGNGMNIRNMMATDSIQYKDYRFDVVFSYTVRSQLMLKVTSLLGSLRTSYKLSSHSSVEGQLSLTKTSTYDLLGSVPGTSYSPLVFVGWRYDFQ